MPIAGNVFQSTFTSLTLMLVPTTVQFYHPCFIGKEVDVHRSQVTYHAVSRGRTG